MIIPVFLRRVRAFLQLPLPLPRVDQFVALLLLLVRRRLVALRGRGIGRPVVRLAAEAVAAVDVRLVRSIRSGNLGPVVAQPLLRALVVGALKKKINV